MKNKVNEPFESMQRLHRTALKVKELAEEDRPREKMLAKGKKELSNAELLAILIGSGCVDRNAVDVAKEILTSNDNDLTALSRLSVADLKKNYKGIGEAKAITITAALELGYRMLSEQKNRVEYIATDSEQIFNYIAPSIIDLPVEEFWAIYLNNRKKIIFKQRISSGGMTELLVDIRRIFCTALEKNASCIAVAHNHPTGYLQPSKKDIDLTKSIMEAGNILNIKLIDHLIVGIENNVNSYYSFFDNSLVL